MEKKENIKIEKLVSEKGDLVKKAIDNWFEQIPKEERDKPIIASLSMDSKVLTPQDLYKDLTDQVTYTLSCSSAQELGPAVIAANGISYIGYLPYLNFVPYEGEDADGAFKDIWAGGANALIDGKTSEEAYNWVKNRYEYWISHWENNSSWVAPVMLSALKDNYENLKIFGKIDARIRSDLSF